MPPRKNKDRAGFLRQKLAGVKLGKLIYLEVEGWIVWFFGGFPGIVGFALRNAFYRLLFQKIKGFCWIQPNVRFVECRHLSIGRIVAINSGTYINAIGGIRMGDYVLIGSNVTISSGLHPIAGKTPPVFARPVTKKEIVIEDDVWIGAGAVIMPGIKIAQGTVVGANSVVTKSTEAYSVVVGAPARKIRSRNDV
jgi:acetyltransferase-like isoleucine patch superfamily enzyme